MGRAPCCDKTSVKRGPWSPEEDSKLKDYIEKHGTGGNWISLPHKAAAQLPGRTDNDIKNYWNTKLKKKLMALHHPRKPSFPPSSSFLDYFTQTPTTFNDLQTISHPSNNYPNTSFNPFYQNQDSMNPHMQYNNYPIIKDNNNMFMFGSEGSCTSSDGSCKEIKQEEIGYHHHHHHHHMSSIGFDEFNNNNNFMISSNNESVIGGANMNQYEEKSSGVGYSYNSTTISQTQTLTPLLDYGLEDIKHLISSNNNNIKGFNVDEIHKNEENGMYYHY
ncbi:hypothetical protein RYX36_036815 [Vicia faba]